MITGETMFSFLKRKQPAEISAEPVITKEGFFSTSMDSSYSPKMEQARALEMFNASIKRTAKDFMMVKTDSLGKEVTVAMDNFPSLQFPKDPGGASDWGVPSSQLNWYANQSFIGYQVAAILMQHWLIDKACTMPARDACRHGFEITRNDGEEMDPKMTQFIQERDKAFGVKSNMVEFVRFGRGFGIRHAMFEVDSTDPTYYEKPFNIDGVVPGSYKGISQIDPYWITPLLDAQSAANPASKHFYEPTWWIVNGKRVHRTHLCIMRNGDEMADILKPTYFYGGVPVPQKIAERVFAAERTANEAPMLAMTKRLISLKTDMSKAMANMSKFTAKIREWVSVISNYGVKVLGENEEVKVDDTSLADLDAVIMTQYQIVAAAAEVPATKLMGTSPKGFGAAGDYEIESYHEFLESIQEHDLTPLLTRHHALLMKSEVMPKFKNSFFQIGANWLPVDTPTAEESADIETKKADRDLKLVQAGAIDGTDVRQRIIKDRDSGYTGIEDIVPGGPGDREAQQEKEEELHNAAVTPPEKNGDGEK